MVMSSRRGERRSRARRAARPLLAAAVIVYSSLPSHAREGERSITIPPGALTEALTRLATHTGLQIVYDSRLADNRRSPGVAGVMTPTEGLAKLLAGTGLSYRMTGPSSATVVGRPIDTQTSGRSAATDATALDPIDIGAAPAPAGAPDADDNAGFAAKSTGSGSKTDAPIIETPQSISVITRSEIAARGSMNIKDAVSYTAGVTPTGSFDLREDLVTFRGFPFDWASFFLDGLVMPSTTYAIATYEPYGLDRLEVLKGPSSMLYGQTSTGGMLDMATKRPTAEPMGELWALIGNNDRYQIAFDLGGPVVEGGDWSYRLTALGRKSGTQIDFVRDDRLFIAPALTWRPSAQTTLTLLANVQLDDLGPSGGTQAFLPASGLFLPNPWGRVARNTYGGEPNFDYYKKRQYSIGYDFEHRFDSMWSFRHDLRYRRVDLDYQTAYGLGLSGDKRTQTRGAFGSFGGAGSFVTDNRLQAKWQSDIVEHTTLLGVDYRRTDLAERNYFGAGPSIDLYAPAYGAPIALPATPYADQTMLTKQIGVYLQEQAKIDERLVITLGGRYDVADTDYYERGTKTSFARTDHAPTGRAGVTYLFDNGVAPYASVSTAFTPTTSPNPYGAPYKARTSVQYEAGVKIEPPDWNTLFTAAVFDITQRNVLTDDPDKTHPFGQVQAGAYRSRGFELETKASLTEGVKLIGSYTNLDAKYTQSNGSNLGNSPKGIPRHSAAIWLEYSLRDGPLDGILGGVLEGLTLGAGARHVGERPSTDLAVDRFILPAYTVFDAVLRYEFEKYLFSVNVNNLTNKTTVDCWNNRCWYGQGIAAYVSLKYRW